MADLVVRNVSKAFGGVRAVDDVTLEVRDGEFFTLLGPSGCGKSTLLSMLAGLEVPDAGSIVVGERIFFDAASRTFLPPERRDCGLVFQSYALWPHMTVAENLEFGLKTRRIPKVERKNRIAATLETVGLGKHAERYPHELSGGQQQRAALARTLVARPSVVLLDEPLSNLDAKLREQAREWLREIHEQVGVTTIYVTHDQEEALSLSTRVAVLSDGRVHQVSDPVTLYERPESRLVAEFVGTTHFVTATVLEEFAEEIVLQPVGGVGTWRCRIGGTVGTHRTGVGEHVDVAVRPHALALEASDPTVPLGANQVECKVQSIAYIGGAYLHSVVIGGSRVDVVQGRAVMGPMARATLTHESPPIFTPDDVRLNQTDGALIA